MHTWNYFCRNIRLKGKWVLSFLRENGEISFSSWRDFFWYTLEGDKNLRSNFSVDVSFPPLVQSTEEGLKQSQPQQSPAAEWGASLQVTTLVLGHLQMDEKHKRIWSICEHAEGTAYSGGSEHLLLLLIFHFRVLITRVKHNDFNCCFGCRILDISFVSFPISFLRFLLLWS